VSDQPIPEAHPFGGLRAGSGPLLGRVDIHIGVPRVEYDKLSDDRFGEPSAAIREFHLSARAYHCILSPSTMLGVHLPKGAF
jgi:magnesium chelatase family protein